jgi:hypothetical protein
MMGVSGFCQLRRFKKSASHLSKHYIVEVRPERIGRAMCSGGCVELIARYDESILFSRQN